MARTISQLITLQQQQVDGDTIIGQLAQVVDTNLVRTFQMFRIRGVGLRHSLDDNAIMPGVQSSKMISISSP